MPPPTTSSRFGTSASSSAPVESIDARIVLRDERQLHGLRAGRDDALVEADRLRAAVGRDLELVAARRTRRAAARPSTLRCFASAARPPVSWPTTSSFQPRSLSRSIVGAPNSTPCARHLARLVDHRGGVQQRLRRNAADVEADAAERRRSARPARSSGRGRRRGTPPCSRPAPAPSTHRASALAGRRPRAASTWPAHCGRCGPRAAPPACGRFRRRLRRRRRACAASRAPSVSSSRISVPSRHPVADLDLQLLRPCPRRATARPSSPCRFRA